MIFIEREDRDPASFIKEMNPRPFLFLRGAKACDDGRLTGRIKD